MTMHVKGVGLKFPDGTEQTTAATGSTGGGTGGGTGGSGGYTKSETDTLLDAKANVGVSYTKAETDNKINNKANIGVSYTKAETEARLVTKADVANSYTKAQVEVLIDAAMPSGLISLWSGSTASIPTGWALCNGTNGTPQLTNRFIVGAGGSLYTPRATGGYKDAVAVTHSHTASTDTKGNHSHTANAAGNHTHTVSTASTKGKFQVQGYTETAYIGKASTGTSTAGSHTHTTTTTGNHAHTVTVADGGVSGSGRNLPPYYALAYIMKL